MDCPYGPQEILQTSGLSDYLVPLGDVQGFAEKLTDVTQKPPQITAQTYKDFCQKRRLHSLWVGAARRQSACVQGNS